MLYPTLLSLHGLLRWIVLVLAIVVLFRPFSKASVAFVAALDTQVLFGLLLYLFASPMTHAAMSNMGAAMKDHTLRFFVVEHPFSMILALVAAHVGRVLARKAPDDAARRKRVVWTTGLALVALVVGIPWPFLPYGRPLLPYPLPQLLG